MQPKPKKERQTEIVTEVLGYSSRYSFYNAAVINPIVVRVSGQGPNGRLKGQVRVYPNTFKERTTLHGDGQYSFMHGNSALRWRTDDRLSQDIQNQAVTMAEQWLENNPGALREFKIAQAEAAVKTAYFQLRDARQLVISREKQFDAAVAALGKAQAETI